MGAWGNETFYSTAATSNCISVVRIRRVTGYVDTGYYGGNYPDPRVVEPDESPADVRARLKREHRIAMIDVGRRLRLALELIHATRRRTAFGLEPPPPDRIRKHVAPSPRAPPADRPLCAARSKQTCILSS